MLLSLVPAQCASTPTAYAPLRATHVLALFACGDLENARHVWRRTPADARAADGALVAAWAAVREARAGNTLAAHAALAQAPWDNSLRPLVERATEALRMSTLALIGDAYTVIDLPRVAAALGLDQPSAAQRCTAEGWAVDAASGSVSVTRKPPPKEGAANIGALSVLSGYVTALS